MDIYMFSRTQILSLLAPMNGAKIHSTTAQLPLIDIDGYVPTSLESTCMSRWGGFDTQANTLGFVCHKTVSKRLVAHHHCAQSLMLRTTKYSLSLLQLPSGDIF